MDKRVIAILVGMACAVLYHLTKYTNPSDYGLETLGWIVVVGTAAVTTALTSLLASRTKYGAPLWWVTLAAIAWLGTVLFIGG